MRWPPGCRLGEAGRAAAASVRGGAFVPITPRAGTAGSEDAGSVPASWCLVNGPADSAQSAGSGVRRTGARTAAGCLGHEAVPGGGDGRRRVCGSRLGACLPPVPPSRVAMTAALPTPAPGPGQLPCPAVVAVAGRGPADDGPG